jgi:hypothetical protein
VYLYIDMLCVYLPKHTTFMLLFFSDSFESNLQICCSLCSNTLPFIFVFFSVLGFELRASCLLGRCSTT